jgi:AraC-like DNA-binding protein
MKNPQSIFVDDFLSQLGGEHGQRLFDALTDVRFFIKDRRGVYVHASRVMYLAHGYSDAKTIIGHRDHDFIPAYLADQYTRDDREVLAGKEIWGRVELVMRHPGWPDWHVTSKIPLRAKNGRIIGLAGVSRDLRQTIRTAAPFHQFTPILEYIRDHLASPMEIDSLAQMAGMSSRTFQRHFKKAFHLTPMAYVRQFRVGRACQMLIETDETITTIAAAIGFSDHSHLVREFTRLTGATPGAYRRRYRAT